MTNKKVLWDSMTTEEKNVNANSHLIGRVDDCYRCVNCEVGSWNAWQFPCN